MAASLPGLFTIQEFTDAGALLVGGRLYTYTQGTTTKKTAYTDYAGTISHTYTSDGLGGEYIALNARGELPAPLYLTAGSYDIALKRADGSTIWTRRADPINDSSDAVNTALAASGGSAQVGFIHSVTGAVARTQQDKDRDTLSVFDFMTDAQKNDVRNGTALLDLATPMAAAASYLTGATTPMRLVFPAGIYKYSVSPSWAINDTEIVAEGEVRLRYTGTGNAVIIDAGAAGFCTNLHFGAGNRFHVEAPATALSGAYVRSVHHSKIGLNIHGAGTTSAALRTEFAVVTEFDVVVSVNEAGGWYLGAKPATGIELDKRGAAEQTAYCYFPNPIIEGPNTGIHLANTLGNVFVGGTSEGCSSVGVLADTGASGDRFIGTDFEVNTVADVFCQGSVSVIDCDSDNLISFGSTAVRGVVRGGRHKSILLDTGSLGCSATDTVFNRSNNGGTFTDGGTKSIVHDVRNGGTNDVYLTVSAAYDPPSIATLSFAQVTVTVTGAKLGDTAVASFSLATGSVFLSASVTAADSVTVTLGNLSGIAVDLGAGTIFVKVSRP